jgi:hypothetical protein
MAGVTGLEPAASGVTGQRSNRLSYTPSSDWLQVVEPPAGVNPGPPLPDPWHTRQERLPCAGANRSVARSLQRA